MVLGNIRKYTNWSVKFIKTKKLRYINLIATEERNA